MRQLNSKRYLIAFILTIIIFVIGVGVGLLFDGARLQHSQKAILDEKVTLQSLQLQQRYIDSGLADCDVLNTILEAKINDLSKKMGIVTEFEKSSVFNQEEFELQLHDYFLTEIQFLLLSQEIDKKCSQDSVKVIYFYDDNEYDTQGDILGYLKKVFGEKVLIFSLDSNFDKEPMVNILLTSYNISTFPSVVIDNKVFQGHRSVEELKMELCNRFDEIGKQNVTECVEEQSHENLFFANHSLSN